MGFSVMSSAAEIMVIHPFQEIVRSAMRACDAGRAQLLRQEPAGVEPRTRVPRARALANRVSGAFFASSFALSCAAAGFARFALLREDFRDGRPARGFSRAYVARFFA